MIKASISNKTKIPIKWSREKWLTRNDFGALPLLAGAAARLGGKRLLGRAASGRFRKPSMYKTSQRNNYNYDNYDYNYDYNYDNYNYDNYDYNYDNYDNYDYNYDNYYNFGSKLKGSKNSIHNKRKNFYKSLFTSNNKDIISKQIKLRCKEKFTSKHCQKIFTELLLSIIFTITKKSKINKNRKRILTNIITFIPKNFEPTFFNIKKSHFEKINNFLYILQDHSYGTFNNARLASLIYEYIHDK